MKRIAIVVVGVSVVGGVYIGQQTLGADVVVSKYEDRATEFVEEKVSTIEAAGEIAVEFKKDRPEVRLKKWNGEVNLGVRYDGVVGTAEVVNDKVIYGKTKGLLGGVAKEEVHAYTLAPKEGMEDGGVEIEVVLNEKPTTNVFSFTIDGAENLDFFYQPALTQQEIDDGSFRPENVIGSYAVYHRIKANHILGDTNYATGKAYHIYRPKAIDANGVEAWGELSYDGGILSVIVPQKFLDDAVYPVKVDPTFGYTSIGASASGSAICNNSADTSTMIGKTGDNTYPLTEAATLDSMSTALKSGTGATETVDTFFALYREDSAGTDSHDLVASAETLDLSVITTSAFYTIDFASESLTADTYILAALCDGIDIAGTGTINITTDTGGSDLRAYAESSTGAGGYAARKAENPWTEVDAASTLLTSIYATYTATPPAATNIPSVILRGQWIIDSEQVIIK